MGKTTFDFSGQVAVVTGGARVMIEEGLLDGEDAPSGAFAMHVTHRRPAGVISAKPGPTAAAADTIQMIVRGQGATPRRRTTASIRSRSPARSCRRCRRW